jgi:hypothetical protein
MEGDGLKLPMVLYEYIQILDSLEKKKAAATATALEPLFGPMITITKKYLDLAITCNTVVMATFLHPAWRMMLFKKRFGSHLTWITQLIQRKFTNQEELLDSLKPDSTPPKESETEPNTCVSGVEESDEDNEFRYYPTNSETVEINTEMEQYNNGVGLLVGQIIIFGKVPAGGSKLQNRLKGYYNNLRVVYWPAPL